MENIVKEIIETIETEFKNSDDRNFEYKCEDGTVIGTDVICVKEWFDQYKDVLLRRYYNNDIFRIKRSVKVSDADYTETSYRKAIDSEYIKTLFEYGIFNCELFVNERSYKSIIDGTRLLQLSRERVCAKVKEIYDDYILIQILDNELGKLLKHMIEIDEDSVFAEMRGIINPDKELVRVITFDIVYRGNHPFLWEE